MQTSNIQQELKKHILEIHALKYKSCLLMEMEGIFGSSFKKCPLVNINSIRKSNIYQLVCFLLQSGWNWLVDIDFSFELKALVFG